MSGIELWGGLECTIARLGDAWRDQFVDTRVRLDDAMLARIAALGLRRLRFPVLWESVSPDAPEQRDWRRHDAWLGALRELGVAPIAGLLHHGSGPRYTDLLDEGMADGLARHAEAVARRYPWLDAYTPVNEPLTTARFSALYGHWYPHARDTPRFLRALVHQCKASVLAMRAVRRVNPAALWVQTEDLGKTWATPQLQYQADYENERRWLSYDLLLGRVDARHPLRGALRDAGFADADIDFFREPDVVPDIVGINHYLTGERYLDERLDRYARAQHGGNGRQAYADVEAVRVHACVGEVGPLARLREVWARYRLPIAVTEVQHGCTRDEQLRWVMEVWRAAGTLRDEGVDLRAVTVWALCGATDWNSLLVERRGHYEPGAFDARSDPPRPTLVARAAESLARDGDFDHPVLDVPGWWRRDARFYATRDAAAAPAPLPGRRLLVSGASGTLGRAVSRICEARGLAHVLLARAQLDVADARSVERALDEHRPWAVVNATGYVRVDDAERERARCFRENLDGARTLAAACARRGIPCLVFSTDRVFDGLLGRAYHERDALAPQGAYGQSKAAAEQAVLRAWPDGALVVRTSAFFGPWDHHNFVHAALTRLRAGEPVQAADALTVSPTYVPDLAHAALDLLLDGERGVWHVANRDAVSWFELARRAAEHWGVDARTLAALPVATPRNTALHSERGLLMPTLDHALSRYAAECETLG